MLERCKTCRGTDAVVMGEGPMPARVMLIGQNPGAEEEKQGRPFVGRSGRYLNKVLEQNGIDRKSLFITSVVKCRTPQNRKPTPAEIDACMPLLLQQIKEINPEIVVLMGEVARQAPRSEGIRYLETYHPSAAMRFPKIRRVFEADFKELAKWITIAQNSKIRSQNHNSKVKTNPGFPPARE